MLALEKTREREIVRFRCNLKRCRRPNNGDPVINKHGTEIGFVTSCSVDVEGCLVGLALVNRALSSPGTQLTVVSLRGKSLQDGLQQKEKVTSTIDITVSSRFPENENGIPAWLYGDD